MPRYVVTVKEVWYQPILIEADSPEKAIALVEEGDGYAMEEEFEYSHTVESDEWLIHEEGKNESD